MSTIIFGFTGTSKSGKTTCCKIMEKIFYSQTLNFADPLKTLLISMGFTREQVFTSKKDYEIHDFFGITARAAMRDIGMRLRESRITWKDSLECKLIEFKNRMNISIGDVRFEDEARLIRKHGGIVIRLLRDDIKGDSNHPSETGDFAADFTIKYRKFSLLIFDNFRGKTYCIDFHDNDVHKNLGAAILFIARKNEENRGAGGQLEFKHV
jgi:hypothetical protein